MNVVLVPRWGVAGAAISSTVCIGGLFIWALCDVHRKLELWPYDSRYLKGLAAGIVASAGAYAVTRLLASHLMLLLSTIAVTGVLFTGTLLLLGIEKEETGNFFRCCRQSSLRTIVRLTMADKNKLAVVLLQLGGPDSLEAVEPFLYNLFCDPDIIDFPLAEIARQPLARLIASSRAKKVQKLYAALGGKSPIVEWTNKQATRAGVRTAQVRGRHCFRRHALLASVHSRGRGTATAERFR